MTDIIKGILARIFSNPKTTLSAIIPFIMALIAKTGFDVPAELITEILMAIYGIILLLIKDNKGDAPAAPAADKSTVTVPTSATTSATLDSSVSDILNRSK
jgi:hypothetical protein